MVKFRRTIESSYTGACDISEYQDVRDNVGITRHTLVKTAEAVPCRLSYSGKTAAVRTETAAAVSQSIKLFLSPEIAVNEGSVITVTQDGITREYKSSGVPAAYFSHQEIMLELSKEWA